jgi:hypothetical protein
MEWNVNLFPLHHKLFKQWNDKFISFAPFYSTPLHSIPLYSINPNKALDYSKITKFKMLVNCVIGHFPEQL